MNQIKFSLSCLAWLNAFIFAHRTLLDDVLLSIETVPICLLNSRPSSCRQMSRPIHYISDALHGLVYISNLWSPFSMKWLKREILGHKKRFCLTNFCQKKCYAFFFSVLFFLSFLLSSSSSSSSFFFIENEQCEKWFFNRVWSPFSPLRFPLFPASLRGQVFAIFFLAIKKKIN